MKKILFILALCSLSTLKSAEFNNPPGGPVIHDWNVNLHSSTSEIGGRLFDTIGTDCYYKKLTWNHTVIILGSRKIADAFVNNIKKHGKYVYDNGIIPHPKGFYVRFTTTMDAKEFQELINKVLEILKK